MNSLNFLRSRAVSLPIVSGDFFPEVIKTRNEHFLNELLNIDEGSIVDQLKGLKPKLEGLCSSIYESINLYYKGFPNKAYQRFLEGIELIEDSLLPITKGQGIEDKVFYRARKGRGFPYHTNEMFHVPFELREHVSTQRFSSPGLPCLYLSNCSYVCWEELRRPNFETMELSCLQTNGARLKFLDLSTTETFAYSIVDNMSSKEFLKKADESKQDMVNQWDWYVLNFIIRWPLIAACSIKVRKEDAPFKPEYIFPQFLLQWVTGDKKFDGIKYFSIEAHNVSSIDQSRLVNYALPVKEFNNEGFCSQLLKSFKITSPVTYERAIKQSPEIMSHIPERVKNYLDRAGLDNINILIDYTGEKEFYYSSKFGQIDMFAFEQHFQSVV